MDLFSRLFLADGPGAERDSFLAARAGVAGRLARYWTYRVKYSVSYNKTVSSLQKRNVYRYG